MQEIFIMNSQKELYEIVEILEDYSNWLHKQGYIDTDYYAEEPKAINEYIRQKYNREI